ncbi:hypothetical protein ACFOY2_24695 [Nonomuraea purpurea]|uniref:Uncharacterized protein n=1 Tax=Nonomuraea purpurea TaxID=1849276 RepID=A0ABV8GCE0_9ACTN
MVSSMVGGGSGGPQEGAVAVEQGAAGGREEWFVAFWDDELECGRGGFEGEEGGDFSSPASVAVPREAGAR